MTERLYYTDPALLEFEGTIVESGKQDDLYYAVLDRSAFYPTSGGQLHDTGDIDGVAVVDVVEGPEGEVRHLTKESVGDAGKTVRGTVDKARRQRHRQQHTAQHVLSQIFHRDLNLETVSVHLGEEYGAIELNTKEMSLSQLAGVEQKAASMVFDNFPVEILQIDSAEAESLPMRREPKRSGKLRIIRIGDFEYSACGGTHCRSTAEIGVIKIIGIEKIRGRVSVRFLAGHQAVSDYSMRYIVTDQLSRTLTCHVSDLPEKFGKIENDSKALRIELTQLRKELLPARAEKLAGEAEEIAGVKFLFQTVDDLDNKLAGKLGECTAGLIGGVVTLHLNGRLIISASEESRQDAGKIAAELVRSMGLKGGGNPRQAHLGGIDSANLEKYQKAIADILG